MRVQKIIKGRLLCAIFVRSADLQRLKTTEFLNSDMVLQTGVVAHHAGYVEKAHYHKKRSRPMTGVQQMIYMAKGKMAVDFFDSKGKLFKTVVLKKGDMMLIIDGVHRIRVLEETLAPTVKLGPYPGPELDKVIVDER